MAVLSNYSIERKAIRVFHFIEINRCKAVLRAGNRPHSDWLRPISQCVGLFLRWRSAAKPEIGRFFPVPRNGQQTALFVTAEIPGNPDRAILADW